MKNLKIYLSNLAIISGLLFSSCELVEVTDLEAKYQIASGNVVQDIDDAETLMAGVYGQLTVEELITWMDGITSGAGLTMAPGGSANSGSREFYTNSVTADSYWPIRIWTNFYNVINNANHVIDKTSALDTDDPRKTEIIAEARFVRGLSHFYLMRFFGEHWDETSAYGVVIKDGPIISADPEPRSTVGDTYSFILEDLEYAIANAPDFTTTIYASKVAAMGLKSKVLLYKGDYAEAASTAMEVINSGIRELDPSFENIWLAKTSGVEPLFVGNAGPGAESNSKYTWLRFGFMVSPEYIADLEASMDARGPFIYQPDNNNYTFKYNGIWNGAQERFDVEYFLRLGEVYLIYAEAELRSGGDITAAMDAVNAIRTRGGNAGVTAASVAEALELVRQEKYWELGAEAGEEYFDLVRYHKVGDINFNDFKPLPDETRLIIPIPDSEIQVTQGIVEQNPGY